MADSYYNYEASKEVLIRRLSEMYKSAWSPTPERKELKALAKHLNKTVDLLQNNRWLELEENIDNPSLWETGIDRNIAPSESRPGYFQSTCL